MNDKLFILEKVFEGLMQRYSEHVPDVNYISNEMIKKGIIKDISDIENDHVAFRTLGVKNLGIASLEKIFLYLGYQKRDSFYFEGKKLDAYWYSPPTDKLPRIFISELRIRELSENAQSVIKNYTDPIKKDPVDALDLNNWQAIDQFLHASLWQTPTLADYDLLMAESEYASWVIYNRYYLNHYTISVHNLPKGYNTIPEFNVFLESIGVKLNTAGGIAKVSEDGLLIQSSTVAAMIEATFADGEKKMISGSYVEFAERKIRPEFHHISLENIKREHRRDGFETGNADKIFESTFTSQTLKDKKDG